MNRPYHRSRSVLMAALIALGAGGLTWSVTAQTNQQPKVSVKIDDQPIARDNISESGSFAPIVKRVAPAVVKVEVTSRAKDSQAPELPPFLNDPLFRHFFGDQFGMRPDGRQGPQGQNPRYRRQIPQRPPETGLGSGVIVSSDGYILTNNHVVHDADEIKVTLNDRREFTAKRVGTDPDSDLAVIKVDAKDLPAITFADSSSVEVGDRVLAIGNPFGIGQTVTSGMVSALGRATFGLGYEDFIQTDAAINPGNSGGALVDVKGRLVGVNTAILSRSGGFQGIGFAIPSDLAHSVMQQLVEHGKVTRGQLGVMIQDVDTELAEAFDLKSREGALIAEVTPGSAAAQAGLKNGDVVTEFNGQKIVDTRRLKLAVGEVPPGKEVNITVLRDGKPMELKVTVGDPQKSKGLARRDESNRGSQGQDDEGTLNGVGVTDLDPQVRREFNVPSNVQGVIVTDVDPTSKAAEEGLQPGDVIQEINREPVRTAEDAIKMTENPPTKKTLLKIYNQRGTRYLVVDETEKE